MTFKIEKDVELLLDSKDGGVNIDTKTTKVVILECPVLNQVVVQGLVGGGAINTSELESLLDDMKYIENKMLT